MNALFEEFSAGNAAAWKERLSKDLKGITFEELSVTDRNGITVHPFYTAEDESSHSKAIFEHKDWTICAAVIVKDEKAANQKALNELQNGASGLCFRLSSDANLSVLLNEIQLPYIYTQFNVSGDTTAFLSAWENYLSTENLQVDSLNCTINFDPIADIVENGNTPSAETKENFFKFFDATKSVAVKAAAYQNAGASSAYQLACCAAQTNEYLHWLDESGKIAELKKVSITLSTGTDFFEEIAKLRAFRVLMSNLFAQYNCAPAIHLHIETSDTYRSAFDSYSNLLRDTIAGMAAVLGGCNSLLIHSFDQSINEAGEFNSRMSRNQQLIFKEESYLGQIADASAGSFYLEKLSEQLADKAWDYFKEMEADGGLVASFEKIKTSIEMQAEHWIEEYKSGKRVLIGVNKYVNAKDEPKPSADKEETGKGLKMISLTDELI
ncbi:MAG: methylmalonyl-CoA mutase family protein [Chitinophagaceae bacterium]|jgi:methylmalonyl-CoA mutase